MTKDSKIITPKQFIEELRRYQKGSVTRRHFLGVTGLGLATPFWAAPCLASSRVRPTRLCRAR